MCFVMPRRHGDGRFESLHGSSVITQSGKGLAEIKMGRRIKMHATDRFESGLGRFVKISHAEKGNCLPVVSLSVVRIDPESPREGVDRRVPSLLSQLNFSPEQHGTGQVWRKLLGFGKTFQRFDSVSADLVRG